MRDGEAREPMTPTSSTASTCSAATAAPVAVVAGWFLVLGGGWHVIVPCVVGYAQ